MAPVARPLRREEFRRASRLLAAAFADDPFIGDFFTDRGRRRLALPPFFRTVLHELADGGALFALETAGSLAGVAAWAPPEAAAPGGRSRRLAWIASREVDALFPRAARRLRAGFETLAVSHPTGPHWYLAFVGIDPHQQRRGLGRAILAPVLARADEHAVPCYLETPFPDTRAFYRSLGFEETGRLHPVPGAPAIWTMRRPTPSDALSFERLS
jgi:ribosomal protein S18 acetylase RimI-like enzyme